MYDTHAALEHHDVVTRVYTEEVITAFRDQIQEVDRLADELHQLLRSYETMIEREGMTDQVDTLVRWAESYSSGLSTASRIARDGHALLRGLDQRMNPEKKDVQVATPSAKSERKSLKEAVGTLQGKCFSVAARQVGKLAAPVEQILGRLPVRTARAR